MGIKKSVSLSDSSIAFANARFEEINWSPIINGAIADLKWLLKASTPDLSAADWLPILNAYNGHFFDTPLHRSGSISIASCIMDDHGALELKDLPEEYREPVRRIAKLTQAEQMATLDIVRRFWQSTTNKTISGDTLEDQIKNLINS